MSPVVRRICYVSVYELGAIAFVTFILSAFGFSGGSSLLIGVVSSVVAVIWNYIWNTLFERWESRQSSRTRTLRRRVVHAIGFEGGLIVFLVPIVALVLSVDLLTAFGLEAGLLIFFLLYTFVFAWCFDKVFGPPASAREDSEISGKSPAQNQETRL